MSLKGKLDEISSAPPLVRKVAIENDGDIHNPHNFESDDEFKKRILKVEGGSAE